MPHHTPEPRRDRDYEAEQRRARFAFTWPVQTATAAPAVPQGRRCSTCRHQYIDILGELPVIACAKFAVPCEVARAKRGACGPTGAAWRGILTLKNLVRAP